MCSSYSPSQRRNMDLSHQEVVARKKCVNDAFFLRDFLILTDPSAALAEYLRILPLYLLRRPGYLLRRPEYFLRQSHHRRGKHTGYCVIAATIPPNDHQKHENRRCEKVAKKTQQRALLGRCGDYGHLCHIAPDSLPEPRAGRAQGNPDDLLRPPPIHRSRCVRPVFVPPPSQKRLDNGRDRFPERTRGPPQAK
jgi:hypothetical protein